MFTYLWLPFMILPIYAGLERLPSSLLEASADLGAKSFRTFLRVTLPLVFPAVVAGSIFTFSLTLGDYIAPGLITSEQYIGTVIYSIRGQALPAAAAFTFVPITIMLVYLLSRAGCAPSRRCRDGRVPPHARAAPPRRGRDARVHLRPARRDRALRVQRERDPGLADRELQHQVVQRRVRGRGRPRGALALGAGSARRDGARDLLGTLRPSPSPAISSSGARPSRSS